MNAQLALQVRASYESILLASICLLDMFWTVVVVVTGIAIEANPLLAWTFELGPWAFVVVKLASLIPGLLALEFCRIINPGFARLAGRAAVLGYLAIYVFGSIGLHLPW